MSISAMKQALMQLNRDDVYLGHRSKTRADAITALRQAIAEAEQPAHIDHPSRHWDRTCPACVYESDMSEKHVQVSDKNRHETDCKKDFDLLFEANSADIKALQDAQFTLEAIKSADPGTHDEIIDASLHLIKLALINSVFGPIERIAERYGVEI
jgi:hypothetical protein